MARGSMTQHHSHTEKLMKKLIITASAISMLAFGAVASAEQQLSLSQMDGITAGGSFDGLADARARGEYTDAYTWSEGTSRTVDEIQVEGQVGAIDVVRTDGYTESDAYATGGSFADAHGYVTGDTEGTLASDVFQTSYADADTTGVLIPGSRVSAYSYNEGHSNASEIILGRTATANSTSASVAIIGN
jgi:hypothetical protein